MQPSSRLRRSARRRSVLFRTITEGGNSSLPSQAGRERNDTPPKASHTSGKAQAKAARRAPQSTGLGPHNEKPPPKKHALVQKSTASMGGQA